MHPKTAFREGLVLRGGVSMIRIVVKSVLVVLIIGLVVVRPAQAYIDPNTGGILFQVLAAAFALFSGFALLFSRQIRMAFARARRFLRDLLSRGDQRAQDAEAHSHRADDREEQDD